MADLSLILPNAGQIDETNDKLDKIVTLLAAEAASGDGSLAVTDFKSIQMLVRMGLADKFFAIGDQITSYKSSSLKVQTGESTGITAASVDQTTFIAKVGSAAGEYRFTYDGLQWLYNETAVALSDYGITVTGTAAAEDTVLITQVATDFVWDVIGIDHDTPSDSQFTHSMTLGLHNCISVYFNVDSSEALMYVDPTVYPDGLPAGNYAIQLYYGANNNTTAQDGYYYFTTTVDVPAGGQLRHSTIGTYYSDSSSYTPEAITAGYFITYESGSATATLETNITCAHIATDEASVDSGVLTVDEATYTVLGKCTAYTYSRRDTDDEGNDKTYINYTQRQMCGNDNYSLSNIRQWLNSEAAANNWFTPQHGLDRCSSTYQAYDGFMYNFDASFLSVLGKVKKTTYVHACDNEGTKGSVESDELFFLLSRTEVYSGSNDGIAEGSAYAYYSDYSDLSAAGTAADTNRIKYRKGSASNWWERSPCPWYTSTTWYVGTTGHCGYGYNASTTWFGVAPACNIV